MHLDLSYEGRQSGNVEILIEELDALGLRGGIGLDDDLIDKLLLDSLLIVMLAAAIRRRGVAWSAADIYRERTIRGLLSLERERTET